MDKKLSFYCESKNFKNSGGYKQKIQKRKSKKDMVTVIDDKIVVNEDRIDIEETDFVTSGTYATKKKRRRNWSKEETEVFYESLKCCGCEFSMISSLFSECTRNDVKNKYKREMKKNKAKMEDALSFYLNFDSDKFYSLKNTQINDK